MRPTHQTRQGYVDALIELAGKVPELVVLDADVSMATKTCDFEKMFPNRFFNCGAQEQNMLSVAAGLALEGFIPFATTFGVFATARAGDQLRNSIAYPKLNVKVAATHCGSSTGGDGASHQANEDIAVVRSLPNMTVLVPGDYEEARQATKAAARFHGPVYLRLGGTVTVVQKFSGSRSPTIARGTGHNHRHDGHHGEQYPGPSGKGRRTGDHLPTASRWTGCFSPPLGKRGIVTAEEHSVLGGLGSGGGFSPKNVRSSFGVLA